MATVCFAVLVVADGRHAVVLAEATRVRHAALAGDRDVLRLALHEVENLVVAAAALNCLACIIAVCCV